MSVVAIPRLGGRQESNLNSETDAATGNDSDNDSNVGDRANEHLTSIVTVTKDDSPSTPEQMGASLLAQNNRHGSGTGSKVLGSGGPASALTAGSVNSSIGAADPASTDKVAGKKKKKAPKKIVNVALTKYPLIREVANKMGFTIQGDREETDESVDRCDYNLLWTDTVLPIQRLSRLANWQRTNHFPSMSLLCRKVHLGITLGRMRKIFPAYYNFFPRTFSLRSERQQFMQYLATAGKRKTFILKPNAGCQGRGIILTRDPLNAVEDLDQFVVQEYIAKPLLIEKKKFDLRVYCLVTSVRNLSVMLFNNGLVRMCAEDYQKPTEENLSVSCMHLTNYAVNKHHENFEFNTDADRTDIGSKRDFRFLNSWLQSNGHSVEQFWDRIAHMLNKALIAAQPQLMHVYNSVFPHNNDGWTCFEVLGFDIMIDDKMKPWLLEVNHTPSLSCDTPIDHMIKSSLIEEVWGIINVQASDKQRHQELERVQFARRMNARFADSSSGGGAPDDAPYASLGGGQAGAVGGGAAVSSEPQTPEEHRADEDQRLKGFRRIYPAVDPERQALYDQMLAAARDATAVQSTACQEQRQAEARQEREKREAARRKDKGVASGAAGTPTAPTSTTSSALSSSPSAAFSPLQPAGSSNASNVLPGSSARMQRSGPTSGRAGIDVPEDSFDTAEDRQPTPPSRPAIARGAPALSSRPSARRSSSSSMTSGPAKPGPQQLQHGTSCPSSATTNGGSSGTNGSNSASAANSTAGRTREDRERMRQRLEEQMDRHRRRMVLGPRLSVFQLRDAQVAAMVGGDEAFLAQYQLYQQQQQHQQQSMSTASRATHIATTVTSANGTVYTLGQGNLQYQPLTTTTGLPQRTHSMPSAADTRGGVSSAAMMAQLHRYRITTDVMLTSQLPIYDLSHSIDTGEGFDEEEEE